MSHASRALVDLSTRESSAGIRVLFVDDEPLLLCALELGLRHLGFDVTSFLDPREAFVQVEQTPQGFDVVITDLQLPGWSGIELADRIRAIAAQVPILLLTGGAVTGSMFGHVDAIVLKPATPREIADAIRGLVPSCS
ncbi:MAG: response regulator [Polyangiaceae bacterium]|nr:response regulator [Polyangiaceae bacterium]